MATRQVTIKDVAKQLNTSVGSVSKALTGKPGISDETRKKIIDTAKEMGYTANRSAQCLARKPINIAIVYPYAWEQYFNDIITGIREALEELRDYNVIGKFFQFSDIYSDLELYRICDDLVREQIDAVILCPASVISCESCLLKLHSHHIPVFLIGNDFKSPGQTGCVRVNAYMSGQLASEILCFMTPPESNFVIFLGDNNILEHREKVQGFCDKLFNHHYLLKTFETHDEPEIASVLTKKALYEIPNIQGFYIATGNSLAICNVLREEKRSQEIKVIATDLLEPMIPLVKDGTINAVIYQYPKEQGRQAIMQCYHCLVEHSRLKSEILVDPRAIFSSNL